MNKINNIFYEARIKKGMTQQELSEKLGYSTSQFISLIESDKSKVPLDKILLYCKALDIKPRIIYRELLRQYREKIDPYFKGGGNNV